ncbi:uncharacterized protein N7500_010382 [Penicillium coprophilum]|uniref:uncharacterized protein n=1 Tax=Penicillium coprophilum TaxID=36646 RepID=UPI00238A48D5|nr:uncharacterized protein N7500_010382 [Penicillium coprophilum]KAJ5154943.1 hypothetical protein N7500_010382 [Penicillium coprophilum]
MQSSEYSPRGKNAFETVASASLILLPFEPTPEEHKHRLIGPNPNLNAPLENLPPEIRRHLLSMMELQALKSLVHASPVIYQQYLVDQKWVLCRSLAATFRSNGLIYEVGAVYQSSRESFWETRTAITVTRFVQAHRDGRSSSHNSPFSQSVAFNRDLTLDEVISMMKFYLSIIQPLKREYAKSTLHYLTGGLRTPYDQTSDILSETEEIRVVRALYRFQLCCNLFAHGHNGPILKRAPEFEARNVWELLQLLFDPWEIEEIVCIHDFAMNTYRNLSPFDWNRHRLLPRKYHQQPVDWSQRLTDETRGIRFGTIARGLELLRDIVSPTYENSNLIRTGLENDIDTMEQAFALGDAFSDFIKERRYPEAPLYQTSMDAGCDRITFQGDVVDDSEWKYPPLGWTLTWDGAHIAGFHCWLKHQMVAWGYVMWDATRLISMGVKDLLESER